jgi:hypothetical protein
MVAVLPFTWALMVLAVVAGFVMIVAYWLDIQDRTDLRPNAKIGWSAAVLVFPISIPLFALVGGARWPTLLKVAAFIPAVALGLFLLFVFGVLGV